jgi:hypothetical protein
MTSKQKSVMNLFDSNIIVPVAITYVDYNLHPKMVFLGHEPKEILEELELVKKYKDFNKWYSESTYTEMKKKYTLKLLTKKI